MALSPSASPLLKLSPSRPSAKTTQQSLLEQSKMSGKAAVFRAIAEARRSSRRFQTNRPIPDATLRDVLETTLRSPSSFNLQPSQIVLVRDPEIKASLADQAMLGAGNAFRTRDCSALAVFLADLEPSKRLDRLLALEKNQRHPGYRVTLPLASSFLMGEGHASTWLKRVSTTLLSTMVRQMPGVEPVQAWSYKNTALAVQSYVLSATANDLATAIMEGYDPRRCKEILRIPDRYDIPMIVATGYEYFENSVEPTTLRFDLEEMVFEDEFGSPVTLSEEDGGTLSKANAERPASDGNVSTL